MGNKVYFYFKYVYEGYCGHLHIHTMRLTKNLTKCRICLEYEETIEHTDSDKNITKGNDNCLSLRDTSNIQLPDFSFKSHKQKM